MDQKQVHAHDAALAARHAGLDARIAEESGRPMPEETRITQLKKEKLRLKDELRPEIDAPA